MSNIGYIDSVLGALPKEQKAPLKSAFEHVMRDASLGAFESGTRPPNLNAVWREGTTSTTANQEVSIVHGLGRTPTYAIPIVSLATVNSQTPVVSVPRAADGTRVYLASASTNVSFAVLVG